MSVVRFVRGAAEDGLSGHLIRHAAQLRPAGTSVDRLLFYPLACSVHSSVLAPTSANTMITAKKYIVHPIDVF